MRSLPVFVLFVSGAVAQNYPPTPEPPPTPKVTNPIHLHPRSVPPQAPAQPVKVPIPSICDGRPTASVSAIDAYRMGVIFDSVGHVSSYDACWLSVSAAKGWGDAFAGLGFLTLTGKAGVPQDLQEGTRLLKESLEYGSRQGMGIIAQAYTYGWAGFPENTELARAWEAAADLKGPVPTTPVGARAPDSNGEFIRLTPPPSRSVPQQPRRAAPKACGPITSGDGDYLYRVAHNFPDPSPERTCYLRQAADLGVGTAQYELAQILLTNSGGTSQAEALQWFIKAGDNGTADGYAKAAEMYQKGIGVAADPNAAKQLYAKADQTRRDQQFGNAVANKSFGLLARAYESEEGKLQRLESQGCKPGYASEQFSSTAALKEATTLRGEGNGPDALCWAKIAAAKGDKTAYFEIWTIYRLSDGLPGDKKDQFRWVLKAGESGDSRAYFDVASCYNLGIGVEPNPKEALRWYYATIEANVETFDFMAMREIAKSMRSGRGVEKFPELADKYDAWAKSTEENEKAMYAIDKRARERQREDAREEALERGLERERENALEPLKRLGLTNER